MERLLELKEEYLRELARKEPGHPHLPLIKADVAHTREELALFNQRVSEAPAVDPLRQAIQEYKTVPHTPELIDRTWQTIWRVWGDKDNHTYEVPSCDRTEEQLALLRSEGKGVLLIPDEVYTPEGLIRLGRMFPKMRSWSVAENTTVTNAYGGGGCIDVEMTVDAPYRTDHGHTEQQLINAIAADGRKVQRLPTYIVGSQIHELLTGRRFDEGQTWSRLLGSSVGGSTLDAGFDPDGGLVVSSLLNPQSQDPLLGGRSEGVKKA